MILSTEKNKRLDSVNVDVSGMTKLFGRLKAVDHMSMTIASGEVVGLIGPNGSGKSTLVKLITGALRATDGQLRLGGDVATAWTTRRRTRWGLAATRQIARPVPELTVYENVAVGAMFGRQQRLSHDELDAVTRGCLDDVGLSHKAAENPGDLPVEQLKLLEMARALATDPSILILDEVLAGVSQGEARDILDLIRRKRSEGLGVLFIEHRLADVLALSDRIYVIEAGRPVAEGTPQEIADDPEVLRAYLGLEQP